MKPKLNETWVCAATNGTNVKPWSDGSPADLVLSRVGSRSLWISVSPPCISPVRSWRMGDGHLEDEGMKNGRQIISECPSSVHMKTSTSDSKQLIPLNHFSSSHWRKPCRRLQFMRLGKQEKLLSWSLQGGQGAARHSVRLFIKANEAEEGWSSWTQVEISLPVGMSAVLHRGCSWQGWWWSSRVRRGQPGGAKPSCHGVWFPTDWHGSLAGLRWCSRHRTADARARLVPRQPSEQGHNDRIHWLTCTLKNVGGGIHFGIMIAQTNCGCNDADRSTEVPNETLPTPSSTWCHPLSFCTFFTPLYLNGFRKNYSVLC